MFLQMLAFLGLVAATWWPGYRTVAWLDSDGELPTLTRVALGLPVALGAFSVVAGPLLLAHAPYEGARVVLLSVWAAALLAAIFVMRPPAGSASSPGEPTVAEGELVSLRGVRARWVVLALAVAGAIGASVLAASELLRKPAAAGLALLIAISALVVRRELRRRAAKGVPAPAARAGSFALDHWFLAVLLVVLLVGASIGVREDADDVLYLSEAIALQGSSAMGAEAPTHRGEDLPATTAYAWQAFELWGSLLADIAGLHVLVAFRTALAPLVVLVSLLLYTSLLRRHVPRALLPLAAFAVLAYFGFAASSHFAANNFLLVRAAQGKTWFMHAGVPALAILVPHFLGRPRAATLALVVLVAFACLGFAPSAVFLTPILLGVLAVSVAITTGGRPRIGPLAAVGLAAVPLLAFGLYVVASESAAVGRVGYGRELHASFVVSNFYHHLGLSRGGGAVELFLLSVTPLLLLAHPRRERAGYPVVFTGVFVVTVLNPVVFPWLSGAIGDVAYRRLLWLVPFPLLLALSVTWFAVHVPTRARGLLAPALPLVLLAMGGHFAWSPANVYAPEHAAPWRATNAYKMPGALLTIAEEIARSDPGRDRRILCGERAATHLAAFDRRFNFVYTRPFQTEAALLIAGREEEAERRRSLAREFLAGEMDAAEAGPLLLREHAAFAVLERPAPAVVRGVRAAGFERRIQSEGWELWARP